MNNNIIEKCQPSHQIRQIGDSMTLWRHFNEIIMNLFFSDEKIFRFEIYLIMRCKQKKIIQKPHFLSILATLSLTTILTTREWTAHYIHR